jgi:hypothetical protein
VFEIRFADEAASAKNLVTDGSQSLAAVWFRVTRSFRASPCRYLQLALLPSLYAPFRIGPLLSVVLKPAFKYAVEWQPKKMIIPRGQRGMSSSICGKSHLLIVIVSVTLSERMKKSYSPGICSCTSSKLIVLVNYSGIFSTLTCSRCMSCDVSA